MLMFIIANSLCFYLCTSTYLIWGTIGTGVHTIPRQQWRLSYSGISSCLCIRTRCWSIHGDSLRFLVPFVIVATRLITNKELDYLILKLHQFKYQELLVKRKTINLPKLKLNKEVLVSVCENDSTGVICLNNGKTSSTNNKE